MATVEPRWLTVETMDPDLEWEIDVNSREPSYRYRERRYTGEEEAEWRPARSMAVAVRNMFRRVNARRADKSAA